MTTVIILPQKRAIRLLIEYLTVRFDMWNSLVVSTWGVQNSPQLLSVISSHRLMWRTCQIHGLIHFVSTRLELYANGATLLLSNFQVHRQINAITRRCMH